jgi:hypothetical protein
VDFHIHVLMRLIPQTAGQSFKVLPETRWILVRTNGPPWFPVGIYTTESVLKLRERRSGSSFFTPRHGELAMTAQNLLSINKPVQACSIIFDRLVMASYPITALIWKVGELVLIELFKVFPRLMSA